MPACPPVRLSACALSACPPLPLRARLTLRRPLWRGQIKRATIMRDKAKGDKSRGAGFVEFGSHDAALAALRGLNNNPTVFTVAKRPIVEARPADCTLSRGCGAGLRPRAALSAHVRLSVQFALEDARMVQKKAQGVKSRLKRAEKTKARQAEGGGAA